MPGVAADLRMRIACNLENTEASPTEGVIDIQSVETTEAGGLRGCEAGKKINSRKHYLAADTLGLPLNLAMHAADIQFWPASGSDGGFLG